MFFIEQILPVYNNILIYSTFESMYMYVYINYDKRLNKKKCILWWDEYLFGMIHFMLIMRANVS